MLRPGNVHSADNWRVVLDPILARYERTGVRRYFKPMPPSPSQASMSTWRSGASSYAIRLTNNQVLEAEIAPLLRRPVGRPPKKPIIW